MIYKIINKIFSQIFLQLIDCLQWALLKKYENKIM